MTEELIGQQTDIATGEIPDPKAEQAMIQQQRLAPKDGNGEDKGNPKDPKNLNGNFGKMLRAAIARRMTRHAGPRFGVSTTRKRRSHRRRRGEQAQGSLGL